MADRPVSPSDAHFDNDDEGPLDDAPETDGPDVPADAAGGPDEVGALHDRLLRTTAEYDNYRRRSVADRQEAVRQGRTGVLIPFLEVYDDLRRSLDAARQAADPDTDSPALDALTQGVDLVVQKFTDALDRVGVTPIEAVGQPFSEDEHEAMMQQPATDEAPSGTVLAEVQPGYRLGDRVLRHARVIVAE